MSANTNDINPKPPMKTFRTRTSHLPIVHKTSAGGIVIKIENGQAYVAVISRRNRAGKLEWCLPKDI